MPVRVLNVCYSMRPGIPEMNVLKPNSYFHTFILSYSAAYSHPTDPFPPSALADATTVELLVTDAGSLLWPTKTVTETVPVLSILSQDAP